MTDKMDNSATFYQYKLIKKVPIHKRMNSFYLMLPCLAVILEMILISWTSIFYFVLAAPIVLWIHYVISRSTLLIAGFHYRKRWAFSMTLPWLGYMPNQHITYRLFLKINSYTIWIGLCLFLVLMFWSPLSFTIALLIWHLWLMLPRLYAISRLSSMRKDGMIKFNTDDISYYKQ
ncbi:hypothetical protein PMSD_15045 [Paenibacillus macquariensis subsp. defensor]|nr:hypothetical protein PMSD_15045 [Paenibacillus macquariensis subsp. defensor]